MPDPFDKAMLEAQLITVSEFAALARLSRRQIDRYRKRRPPGFPRESDVGSESDNPRRRSPRFKLTDVKAWLRSRESY
jgi:predicted DNA-binding transcriptional regulator AlpA